MAQLFDAPPRGRAACRAARSEPIRSRTGAARLPGGDVTGSQSAYVGSRARTASAPSVRSTLSRASSTSQLLDRLKAWSPTKERTSSAVHGVGSVRSSRSSCGRRDPLPEKPASMPATYASSMARTSAPICSRCASALRRNPSRRLMRSMGIPSGPMSSASVPEPTRRRSSSWKARSWAWQKPRANQASASVAASTCGMPHRSRRMVMVASGPETTRRPRVRGSRVPRSRRRSRGQSNAMAGQA
jgi:hypothetical protein